jgi:hypothetical protein
MNNYVKSNITLWHSISFAFGLAIGALVIAILPIPFEHLVPHFDTSLSGSIIEAGATIVTGLVVALYVQRILHTDVREKDMVICELENLGDIVGKIEKQDNGWELNKVNMSLKKARIINAKLVEIVDCLCRRSITSDKLDFSDEITELRKLATLTPTHKLKGHPQSTFWDTEVKHGILFFEKEREERLEVRLMEFSRKILEAKVLVMRS